MPKTIQVGLITNAEGAHVDAYLPSLARTEEAAGVALADPSGKMVARARAALGKKLRSVHKDAGDLLKTVRPQMALVSLPADVAPAAIDQALESGCHVFAEKPSCVRAADFEKLVRKAEQKHRHLMLALANRLHPGAQEARRLIQKDLLGRIYAVEIHFIADQTRLKRPDYRAQWYCQKKRAGGGHLIWLGIHWLDLALFITGLRVQQVAGFTGVVGGQPIDIEDSAAVALAFDNRNVFGTMISGYYLDRGYHSHVKVWGEHGWLKLAAVEDTPLEWYSTRDNKNPQVQTFKYPRGQRGYFPFVRAGVRAAAGLQDAPITGAECLHVLQAIFGAYRAAETGRTVRI
jgi:UDP-N-acetyl-2-amino-2-deoxyglucuronate dehydrogenase